MWTLALKLLSFLPLASLASVLTTVLSASGPVLALLGQVAAGLLSWVWEFIQAVLAKPTRVIVLLLAMGAASAWGYAPVLSAKRELAQCQKTAKNNNHNSAPRRQGKRVLPWAE